MDAVNCKCGASARTWHSHCSGGKIRGNGFIVFCESDDDHCGWHAKTRRGAITLWNKINKSSLTVEEITQARMGGLTVSEAIRRYGEK